MDHSECVQVDQFTRTDVHHTHEGQAGWWLFPSEAPNHTEEQAVRALIKHMEGYVRDNTPPVGDGLPEGITLELHPGTLSLIRRWWVPSYQNFTKPLTEKQSPFPLNIPVQLNYQMEYGEWRLAVIKVDVINSGKLI